MGRLRLCHPLPQQEAPLLRHGRPGDPRCTLSFDLLFRGMEVTTGGQRVHDYQPRWPRWSPGDAPEEFRDFLTIHQHGMPAPRRPGHRPGAADHEAVRLENVREASLFPRDQSRLEP